MFVDEFAHKDCGITLDTTYLAEVFRLTRSRVRIIRAKAQKNQRPPHRPLALSNEQKLQLCEMIREKAITGNYVMKPELLNYVEANFHASLTYGWIHCFLERRADFVKRQLWHQANRQDFKSRANV
jgi:transposase